MRAILIISFFTLAYYGFGQDSLEESKKLSISGYVKDLLWLRSEGKFERAYLNNLIHNRINVRWTPDEKWSARLEIRNRVYWGSDVHNVPGFNEALENSNEGIDLSKIWWKKRTAVFHTNVERLWLEYRKPTWNVRAGRQRINWGMNNTWNPNDIFNSYNFLDFDYEERPGSDAVKIQYRINDLSAIELAVAATASEPIMAAKYSTNYHGYDLQAIAGMYQGNLTAGFGWAGSLSDVGFKGEAQYYFSTGDSSSQFVAAVEADYIFNSGWYCHSSVLYNGNGVNKPFDGDAAPLNGTLSPLNLMPARWNLLVGTSREFSPRLTGNVNLVYSPWVNMVIVFPSLRYNLASNLDIDFIWQSFFAERQRFSALSHTGFARIKASF